MNIKALNHNVSPSTALWSNLLDKLNTMRREGKISNADYFQANSEVDAAYWKSATVRQSLDQLKAVATHWGIPCGQ